MLMVALDAVLRRFLKLLRSFCIVSDVSESGDFVSWVIVWASYLVVIYLLLIILTITITLSIIVIVGEIGCFHSNLLQIHKLWEMQSNVHSLLIFCRVFTGILLVCSVGKLSNLAGSLIKRNEMFGAPASHPRLQTSRDRSKYNRCILALVRLLFYLPKLAGQYPKIGFKMIKPKPSELSFMDIEPIDLGLSRYNLAKYNSAIKVEW